MNIVEFCNEFAKEEKNNSVVFIVASWKTFSHSDWIFSDVSLIIILINLFYSCYMWLINDFPEGGAVLIRKVKSMPYITMLIQKQFRNCIFWADKYWVLMCKQRHWRMKVLKCTCTFFFFSVIFNMYMKKLYFAFYQTLI